MCVCVCERERERERESDHGRLGEGALFLVFGCLADPPLLLWRKPVPLLLGIRSLLHPLFRRDAKAKALRGTPPRAVKIAYLPLPLRAQGVPVGLCVCGRMRRDPLLRISVKSVPQRSALAQSSKDIKPLEGVLFRICAGGACFQPRRRLSCGSLLCGPRAPGGSAAAEEAMAASISAPPKP